MPPLPSRKIRHPASTVAAPTYIEVFDWQPAHLRPAVVLTRSFGAKGQSVGEAMRSFVVVRAWDLQVGAATRSEQDRWCWWDDFLDAVTVVPEASAELSVVTARNAVLEAALTQHIRSVS